MQILNFSDFAQLRAANTRPPETQGSAMRAVDTDRWAGLHVEAPATAEVIDLIDAMDVPVADFMSDLEFRMAYPTHQLRHH